MDLKKFKDRAVSVLVLEAVAPRLGQISESLRGLGFADIIVATTIDDAFSLMAVRELPYDWILTSLSTGTDINALQLLALCLREKKFHATRVSLLLKENEMFCVGAAFEMGLLSWHRYELSVKELVQEVEGLDKLAESVDWSEPLVAAHYLRVHLKGGGRFEDLAEFARSLIPVFPDSPHVLLALAQAQYLTNRRSEAAMTLSRARSLAPQLARKIDAAFEGLLPTDPGASDFGRKFNLKSCLIVDSDESACKQVEAAIASFGVVSIHSFSDGASAWEWMAENPEPSLIVQEWRIPKLSGILLAQRIRHHGFAKVPIVVYSSLTRLADEILLKELGISGVMEKPLGKKLLIESLRAHIEREMFPSQIGDLEVRISKLLSTKNVAAARKLRDAAFRIPNLPVSVQDAINAEFALAEGHYAQAKELAIRAVQERGESLHLFSMLAKILTRMGEHDAALQFLAKADSLSPKNVMRLCMLAESNTVLGKHEAAEHALGAAKSIDASCAAVAETEAKVAISKGERARAHKTIEKLKSTKSVIAFLNNTGVVYIGQGRTDDAINLYKRALSTIPSSRRDLRAIIHYNLGLALARKNSLNESGRHLYKCLKAGESPVLEKARALIRRVARAVMNSEPLQLNVAGEDGPKIEPSIIAEDDDAVALMLPQALDAKPGEMCLHQIYQDASGIDETVAHLLVKTPHFVDRSQQLKYNWSSTRRTRSSA